MDIHPVNVLLEHSSSSAIRESLVSSKPRPRNRRTSWRFRSFLVVLGARSLSNMIDFNAGDGESLIHCDKMTTGGSGGVSVGTPTRFSFSQLHSSKVTRTTGIEDGEYL